MKRIFTSFSFLFIICFSSQFVIAQSAGDYRTNFVGAVGSWSNIAIWETYNGVSWGPAAAYPTSADGVITISAGDSVNLDNITPDPTIDQVVVDGSLIIFQETVTLADGAGDDIVVNGRLSIGLSGVLQGPGTVLVNPGFTPALQIRNGGNLGVTTVANGDVQFLNGVILSGGATVTLGSVLTTWTSGNITFSGAAPVTLINTGVMVSISTSNDNITLVGGSPAFVNNGIFGRNNSLGILGFGVPTLNNGAIAGQGTISINNVFSNPGIWAPGNAYGVLTITPNGNTLFTGTTETQIQFSSTSTPPSNNTDQLVINSAGATALDGQLTILDDPGAALGVYTIINTTGGGTLTGTFSSVVKPSNFGDPVYTGTSVTIEKLSLVPVIWHSFNVLATNKKVQVSWKTMQESNSSHFDIEHSTNGTNYTSVGKIKAKENSPVVSSYSFVHGNPDLTGKNYYRLKQVDLDGKFTYSEIRSVRFNEGKAAVIVALPNPVKDILQVAVQADDVSIHISDMNGRIYRRLNLRAGNHQVNVSNLPTGNYSIVVYQKNKRVAVQQLIKQ